MERIIFLPSGLSPYHFLSFLGILAYTIFVLFFESMLRILKKKIVWIPLLIVIIVGGIIAINKKPKAPEFSSTTVVRKDLVQSVEETGQVAAALDLTYGFEMNGKVSAVHKQVGDMVTSGVVIAEIDGTAQLQALRQAQATLASAQAALNLKLAGPSDEARAESLAAVQKAKASLAQAEADLSRAKIQAQTDIDTAQKNLEKAENDLRLVQNTGSSKIIDDAFADLLNTVKNAIPTLSDTLTEADDILGIDNTLVNDSFESALGIVSPSALNKAKSSYDTAKVSKQQAEAVVNATAAGSSQASILAAKTAMDAALADMRTLMIDTGTLLDLTPTIGITQSNLDTLKSGVQTALGNVNTDITAIENAKQDTNTAQNSLSAFQIVFEKAKLDRDNTKQRAQTNVLIAESSVNIQKAALAQAEAAHAKLIAPPRAVDVGTLRADVSRYGAAVAAAQKEFEKTKLVALADGVVSKLDIDIGENVTANAEIFGLISSSFTIEVDISESDIAKVQNDDIVEMTLDAFGDDITFAGHVFSIEPAETEISGVIYYKTDIIIDDTKEHDVRPGMTANIRIITDTKPNVLLIPQRAILSKEGKKVVRVLTNTQTGTFEEKEVTTGIRGDEGNIEIVSGLSEGEDVITFIKED